MNMQRCQSGHYYDKSKYDQCPYCNPATSSENRTIPLDSTVTGPMDGGFSSGWGTTPLDGDIGKTMPLQSGSSVTVAIMPSDSSGNKYDPVVGWFVCVEGKDKGADFKIHSGNNAIGRGSNMQIRIQNDDAISKENMAHTAFDPRSRKYFFEAGAGRNLVYVNDELLLPHQSRELHAYDRILLGTTTLLFMPFCGEAFSWE